MNYERNDLIELEDNTKYIVVDRIELNNTVYYYLVNQEDGKDLAVVKECEELGEVFLKNTDSEEEFNQVILKVVEKNKDLIERLLQTNE